MDQKFEGYKNVLKSDPKMVSTLMNNPAIELMKNTDLKLTSEQVEATNNYFSSAKRFVDSFTKAVNSKNEQAKSAPDYLHELMDTIYDFYHWGGPGTGM